MEDLMMTLTINGKPQRYDGDPEMPLLWVLRDELNLKGTKFDCGMGLGCHKRRSSKRIS
jgi:isoquinoline 1-oxidoreductase alpha subunit